MFKKLGLVVLALLLLAGATSCKSEKDELMVQVDKAIDLFIENHLDKFVNEESLDYYVVPAIKALEANGYKIKLTDVVPVAKVNEYYTDYDYSSVANIFKATVIRKAYGLSLDDAKNNLEEVTEVDVWSYTYGLIALNITGVNSALKADLLTKVNVIREEDYRDADYAGLALVATANDNIDKISLHELINTSLSNEGIVTWESANSSSTANVILGLLASGINPTSEEYTTEGVNLIEALLKYHKDGAFANKLGEDPDLMFATPQAFSALVAYKIFTKQQKFNLFS